jgi:hypothetical protein
MGYLRTEVMRYYHWRVLSFFSANCECAFVDYVESGGEFSHTETSPELLNDDSSDEVIKEIQVHTAFVLTFLVTI